MGTRHLIEVKIDGKVKVAQYGQWDGYPTGAGYCIARFIHTEMDESAFPSALRACSFMNADEIDAFNEEWRGKRWQDHFPWLSRDAGADVLSCIQKNSGLKLVDSSDFKGDGLFCEYYYLIDMDKKTVTVNGFDEVPFSEWTEGKMKEMEEIERAHSEE